MNEPFEQSVISPVLESQNSGTLAAMLMVLSDAAQKIPSDYVCTLTVTTGWDDNIKADGLTITITGTPP